ncbi:MAG: hypothetical protein ACOCXA_00165 [Planctomycetota bacterium]
MQIRHVLISMMCLIAPVLAAADYSWQQAHAAVSPQGDLSWAPEAFQYQAGELVRYIDYEQGDDANPGTREAPWRHHPWDPAARETAAASAVPGTTYVFKGGVVYRGGLNWDEVAPPTQPTRLTCDPDWGDGPAVLAGSEVIDGWQQGAEHADIPDAEQVWVAEIPWRTRRLWMVDGEDDIQRLHLARTPNWTESDPRDVLSEWWTWQKGTSGPNPDDPSQKMIIATDPRLSEFSREELEDAIVWTKWGFVMGTPLATKIQGMDLEQGQVAFKGIWYGSNRAQKVSTGHRYYLENKPHFLDQGGEF